MWSKQFIEDLDLLLVVESIDVKWLNEQDQKYLAQIVWYN